MKQNNEQVNKAIADARGVVFHRVRCILAANKGQSFTLAQMRRKIDARLDGYTDLPVQPRTHLVYDAMKRLERNNKAKRTLVEGERKAQAVAFSWAA